MTQRFPQRTQYYHMEEIEMTYLVPFVQVEPDLAEKETRTATLFKPRNGIPAGTRWLVESYCPDPACGCRRIMLNVAQKKHPAHLLASVGSGAGTITGEGERMNFFVGFHYGDTFALVCARQQE